MQKFAEDIKKLFSAENRTKVVNFFKKNHRYFIAALLFVVLVIILAKCTGPSFRHGAADTEGTESTEFNIEDFELDKDFKQDANEGINALIEQYFNAYANDDLDTLSRIAYPMGDNEKSYIGVCSQYIKSYQNISCYTKTGLTDGSYLVSVYYEIEFYGVKTTAPGQDFFYVETDKDGNLYINNLYSIYNFSRTENEMDPNIYAVILKFKEQDDMVAMLNEVQEKYKAAIESDPDLATLLSTTLKAAMKDWRNTIEEEQDTQQTTEQTSQDPASGTDGNTPQTPVTEAPVTTEAASPADTNNNAETAAQNSETAEKNEKVKVRTTDAVYVREKASKKSKVYKLVEKGTVFTKVGTKGKWTKIKYDGDYAYIKSEFLEEVKN